jgi:nucleotide-binding universal stress UspA family protein
MDAAQTRFDRILVPLDGSPLAEQALPFAETVARSGSEVVLLGVMPAVKTIHALRDLRVVATNEDRRISHQSAIRGLCDAADRVRRCVPGAKVRVAVADGHSLEEILRAASDFGVGLVIMASDGEGATGGFRFGGVAEQVARASPVPLLLVHVRPAPAAVVPAPIRRIVVPLDGSDRAARALSVTETLAKRLGIPVLVLTVVEEATPGPPIFGDDLAELQILYRRQEADAQLNAQQTLDWAGARLVLRGIVVNTRLLTGRAAATIRDAAGPGDLVVMTNRGRGCARHNPIGSVAETLITSSLAPLVLVPTGREEEAVAPVFADVFRFEGVVGTL